MELLSQSVAKMLKKKGLQSEAYASLILERTRKLLENHYGEMIQNAVMPQKYKTNVIYITCKNSLWKNEIQRSKNQFLKILQSEFPHDNIKNIVLIS